MPYFSAMFSPMVLMSGAFLCGLMVSVVVRIEKPSAFALAAV